MIRTFVFQRAIKRKLNQDVNNKTITESEYIRLLSATTYRNCKKLLQRSEQKYGGSLVLEAIWDFVVENWDDILKALIMLASLVAEEE